MTVACHPLARAVQPLARRAAPDAALVARFVQDRDQPAFAELVRRHGPTVLAVCRHATRHSHDADDAFQATFLVLARKAHALDPARPLGAWLRGVAVRAGKKAARRRPTLPLGEVARPEPGSDGEAVAAVRAAVAALPPHQRAAVERCELLGRSRAEAAAELGIPAGTLSSRLALARRALAARLRRAGFAPAAVAVPAALLTATASEVPSRRVVELAEAVMRTTWHGWAAGLVAVVTATVGFGLASEPAPAPRPVEATKRDDGRLLVWDYTDQRVALVWLDLDGRQLARVTAADARAAGLKLNRAVCSTPRAWLDVVDMFNVGVVRPNDELPVSTLNGLVLYRPGDPPAVRTLVPKDDAFWSVVAWSPDGRTAVACRSDDGPNRYFRIDADTGERTPLAVPAGHHVCGWSPAGDWLLTAPSTELGLIEALFKSPRWDRPVYRVGRDEAAAPLLGGQEVERPHLSPDGRRLAFSTARIADGTRTETLWAADLDGGRRVELGAHANAMLMSVAWSPDCSRVAYTELRFPTGGGRQGVPHLWVCDADGGNRREVPWPAGSTGGGVVAWR